MRTSPLVLTKHHGSGNDFLIVLDRDATDSISKEEVRALCDRNRGIGADGLIVGRPGSDGADLRMELINADGSVAEMSGNGIRCLVQAAVLSGMTTAGQVLVDTDGGRRSVDFELRGHRGRGEGYAEVDMGPARIGEDLSLDSGPVSLAGAKTVARACLVDVGNPHLVLLPGENEPDLEEIGPLVEKEFPAGVNIEVIRLIGPGGGSGVTDLLDMDVWERGVGITESCGTGSCASAAAANRWGLVSNSVEVRTTGGSLLVKIGSENVTLAGPAQLIAEITVNPATLAHLVDSLVARSSRNPQGL